MRKTAALAACLGYTFSTPSLADMPADALGQISAGSLRAHYEALASDEMAGRFVHFAPSQL